MGREELSICKTVYSVLLTSGTHQREIWRPSAGTVVSFNLRFQITEKETILSFAFLNRDEKYAALSFVRQCADEKKVQIRFGKVKQNVWA